MFVDMIGMLCRLSMACFCPFWQCPDCNNKRHRPLQSTTRNTRANQRFWLVACSGFSLIDGYSPYWWFSFVSGRARDGQHIPAFWTGSAWNAGSTHRHTSQMKTNLKEVTVTPIAIPKAPETPTDASCKTVCTIGTQFHKIKPLLEPSFSVQIICLHKILVRHKMVVR